MYEFIPFYFLGYMAASIKIPVIHMVFDHGSAWMTKKAALFLPIILKSSVNDETFSLVT
jgi:hypothetical protein